MKLAIQGGGTVDISDDTFGAKFNEALIHQVVTAYRARGRAGTKAQKTRAEVSGGGRKPWKQKGSGRARAGTNRSPIWVGGGRVFAARPRDFGQKVNRKMYTAAMRSVLSELVRQDRVVVVDKLDVATPKTKDFAARLRSLGLDSVLIVVDRGAGSDNLRLAARNIPWVDLIESSELNPAALIRQSKVLMTKTALKSVEERLS